MSLLRQRRRRLRDFSCIMWLPPALERRTRPEPLILKRFLAARLVFIFGMAVSFRFRRSDGSAQRTRLDTTGGRYPKRRRPLEGERTLVGTRHSSRERPPDARTR